MHPKLVILHAVRENYERSVGMKLKLCMQDTAVESSCYRVAVVQDAQGLFV